MWFCLFCLLFLVGVAFYQSTHGLFSGLIFCVIAIISAALGFALYEYVGYELLADWKPDFALPIALAGCFGIPLVLGRAIMDAAVKRSGLMPALADKIGGLFFGVITALVCVGVLATAVQMLPFGGSFMTFSRFDQPKGEDDERDNADEYLEAADRMRAGDDNHVWLSPDRFAAGLASMLSDGVFSGERSFREEHPDLLVEIGWQQAAPLGTLHVTKPESFSVQPLQVTEYVYEKTGETRGNPVVQYEPKQPRPGYAFWLLRLEPPLEARDSDGPYRFTLPQIRLVGKDRSGRPTQFIPCAVRDSSNTSRYVGREQHGRLTRDMVFKLWQPGDDGNVVVVFEVPDGFEPSFVTYKSGARAKVSAPRGDDLGTPTPSRPAGVTAPDTGTTDEQPASRRSRRSRRGSGAPSSPPPPANTESPSASASTPPPRPPSSGGGRVTGARARAAESFFGDQLPVRLTQYERAGASDVQVSGEVLQGGSLYAFVARQGEGGTQPAIARFYVPPGKKLLQLSAEHLQAGSTLGRALNFATQTIRNYIVTDDAGQRYEMAGRYAIAQVGGDDILEIQYYPEQIGSVGRGIRDFDQISSQALGQADAQYVLLFLVDEGRQAIEFSTGQRGRIDLTPFNLRAE